MPVSISLIQWGNTRQAIVHKDAKSLAKFSRNLEKTASVSVVQTKPLRECDAPVRVLDALEMTALLHGACWAAGLSGFVSSKQVGRGIYV